MKVEFTPVTDYAEALVNRKVDLAWFGGCKVQAGALNTSAQERLVSEKKVDPAKVRVFFTTRPYHDYNWTVRADMPVAAREKLTQALLSLNRSDARGRRILELQRATRLIPTRADHYKGIEAAAHSAGLL